MSRFVRVQILLTDEQREQLREIARQEGRSVSEVVRELVERYLEERRQNELEEFQKAMAQLAEIREKMPMLPENFLEEIREERAKEQEELLWPDKP